MSIPEAMSRFLGVYVGTLLLAVTYVAAVLSEVSTPSAVMRATLAFAFGTYAGRAAGFLIGRQLEGGKPRPKPVTPGKPGEAR